MSLLNRLVSSKASRFILTSKRNSGYLKKNLYVEENAGIRENVYLTESVFTGEKIASAVFFLLFPSLLLGYAITNDLKTKDAKAQVQRKYCL